MGERMMQGAGNILRTPGYIADGYKSGGSGGGQNSNNDYMKDKLSGK